MIVKVSCPECHSTNVEKIIGKRFISNLHWRCGVCGFQFDDPGIVTPEIPKRFPKIKITSMQKISFELLQVGDIFYHASSQDLLVKVAERAQSAQSVTAYSLVFGDRYLISEDDVVLRCSLMVKWA